MDVRATDNGIAMRAVLAHRARMCRDLCQDSMREAL